MLRILIAASIVLTSCATSTTSGESESLAKNDGLESFLQAQVAAFKPLAIESNLRWYEASISGTDEAFAKSRAAQDAVNLFFADSERFERARALRQESNGKDPIERRQLEVLYLEMLGKQVEPELLRKITAVETKVEQTFNTYRGKIDGKEVTNNDIGEILRTSKSSKKLKAAWDQQKAVGAAVAPKLIELVKLRNQVAKKLGFRDYYALRIAESEQDETALLALFDDLDNLTRKRFTEIKVEVDKRLAKRLGMKPSALMPWHYQNPFFQEPPDVFKTGLDAVYKQKDTLDVCRKFYEGIGLEVDAIIARSDLYEKEGKSPHAFAVDVDREGDVRMIANIVPGQKWQSTMVHELGHAVYNQYIDHNLPWLLRKATHPLTTEGLAMMLDRLVGNPHWAAELDLIDASTRDSTLAEAKLYLAFASLQFSRWTQVMLRFERELYRDPDQDLNTLWWDLVEKYQGLTRPPNRDLPDYASKIHLVVAPVYYHNYMMGDLFAAQVHEAIAKTLGQSPIEAVYVGRQEAGKFLRDKVFAPGAQYHWDELTERITGKRLQPEAFARRFE